ncbi:MAG TPA: hypothetical protein VJ808_12345 [Gemmatimonadales bacterium]|nr:hypothetical protein [Gemmatimonadales bacterium]
MATAAARALSVGLAVVTATVLLVDSLRGGDYPENLSLRLYLLFGGTLFGILSASWVAWRLLRPIPSTYRRGGLAMVTGFATVLLMLVCIPVNQLFGRSGLVVLLVLSAATAVLLARRAKRLGADV